MAAPASPVWSRSRSAARPSAHPPARATPATDVWRTPAPGSPIRTYRLTVQALRQRPLLGHARPTSDAPSAARPQPDRQSAELTTHQQDRRRPAAPTNPRRLPPFQLPALEPRPQSVGLQLSRLNRAL